MNVRRRTPAAMADYSTQRTADRGTPRRERQRRRALGQHFLVDRSAVRRIVAALDPRPGDAVLEIGPGRGALTARLVESAGRIAAIELDPELCAALRQRFGPERLVLLHGDVLGCDLAGLGGRLELGTRPLLIAGNLPYSISKPVAQKLIRERAHVERAVLMFQSEVAERVAAGPGSRRYGPLSVLAGCAFRVRALFEIGPGAFRPPPQVRSTVTRWDRRRDSPLDLDADAEARLRACLAACFARRRRTLHNNLRTALGDERAAALLDRAAIDGARRAESLAADEFLRLAAAWDAPTEGA
jgi:16S rRNA (adenine1518-N6/adenine1519-N6)-dimethyltransferase